ncbi:MAG: response regulator, partial [Gammaproteobacteria bacterium]|nr:response regulator [Gammaproteobacteria bacterium]
SCVACHNSHPDTPRNDWKEGDVRGVVEVVVPLDAALTQTQSAYRESAVVVAGLGGLGLFSVFLVTGRLRRTSHELEKRVADRTSELEVSEQKFRRIFETTADGYVYSRINDGQMIEVNPAAARILGYPSVESLLERRTPELYADPGDRARVLQALGEGGEFQGLEMEMLRKDGSHVALVLNGRVMTDESGAPTHLEASFFDMSTQKETEIALQKAREGAEQANRAKSVFLANMSHELRTPMNAIIGYSEMLMEDAEEDGNEAAVEDLTRIRSAGEHLLRLINEVLDLSKIEAGKMEVVLETFEVRAMIDDVVATIDTLVSKNGNRLVVEVDPALELMRADPTKVRQALFNLLSNAAKFTHEGEIGLVVDQEIVDGVSWINMAISDTGIGIASDKLDTIFEEFSQADDTTSRDYGGTGLGLPISRRFCRMMGGDVSVVSRHGEGSTFTVRLPLIVAAEETTTHIDPAVPASAQAPAAERAERTVLVVDDDPQALDLLGRTLQDAGMRVVTASDGREVHRLARTLQPMAITLDVIMPGMDGFEVLSELKDDPETSSIPVIMVTMTDDRETGYALGATEFLTKPVDRSELVQLLRRCAPAETESHALVVDDNRASREMMRSALEREGWRVTEADNGAQALERLADDIPSLILLDLMMPVMDGFEFVIRMRKLRHARGIPIVVVTAKDITQEDRRRLSADVIGLIQKDGLDRDSLLAQLQEQLAIAGTRVES